MGIFLCVKLRNIVLFFSIIFLPIANSATTMNFDGTLVDTPCRIDQSSLNQNIVFLNSSPRDYWQFPAIRPTEKFTIKLIQCDAKSLWKSVKIKFNGQTESAMGAEQQKYLSLSSGANKGKLAIGFVDIDGSQRITLGQNHNGGKGTQLNDGTMLLTFNAFVQASPNAIANKSVVPGMYNATVEFEVSYE
ncbi:fimbrial protein [Providencia manganoxydans]|uniref:fimbrial protein n=1 Tax=Providencia manganoxydans TaxID=2923283 RepID=UPI0032DAFCA7